MSDHELYHWGIKGMKWGVRRYQNPDGSLTRMGKVRQKLNERAENKKAKKAEEAESERVRTLMNKPLRKLTDSEFHERMYRSSREKQLLETEKRVSELSKEPESIIKRFAHKAMSDVVVPAAINAGKNTLQNYLNAKGGELVKNLLKDSKKK